MSAGAPLFTGQLRKKNIGAHQVVEHRVHVGLGIVLEAKIAQHQPA